MVLVSLIDVKYIVGNHSPKPKDNQKGQQSKKLPVSPWPCNRSLTRELELVGGEEEGAVLPLLDVDEERLKQQRTSTPTGSVENDEGLEEVLLEGHPEDHVLALDDYL